MIGELLHNESCRSKASRIVLKLRCEKLDLRSEILSEYLFVKYLFERIYKRIALCANAAAENDRIGAEHRCKICYSASEVADIRVNYRPCVLVLFVIIKGCLSVYCVKRADLPEL